MRGFTEMKVVYRAVFLLTMFSVGVVSEASAREYDVRLVVSECGDLYEYEVSGDLMEDDFELLLALCHRPLNINRADRYMLYDLPGVTYELADRMVAARAEHGPFNSILDLGEVEGISQALLEEIEPFVSAENDIAVEESGELPLTAEVQSGSVGRSGFNTSAATAVIDNRLEFNRLHQDYLQLKGMGAPHFSFGGLITNRERNIAYWDRSVGHLVSDGGPSNHVEVEKAYLSASYGAFSLVLGSFDVGFGEKVTFDTTGVTNPHGWREDRHFSTDVNNARLRPDNSLFGAAMSFSGLDFDAGWLDMTAFASYEKEDIYQYYYRVQLDEYYEGGEDPDCPFGFSEGESSGCYTTGVYDSADLQASPYRYVSLMDAYAELLYGANATWNFGDRARVGVTGYQASTEMLVASEANPVFAYHARIPREGKFGAIGLNAQMGIGELEMSGEYAHSLSGGNALYLEGIYTPGKWMELVGGYRWYDRNYDNPYSRSPSASTVTLGLRQRNEQGGKLKATIKPIRGIRSVTSLETWYIPEWVKFDDDAKEMVWGKLGQVDLRLDQRVDWDFTRKETVSLRVAYSDNDLERAGTRQIYQTPYENVDLSDLLAVQDAARGHGYKTKMELGLSTRRLKMLSLSARYRVQWEQTRERIADDEVELAESAGLPSPISDPSDPYRYFMGMEQYVTARATLRFSEGTRVVLNGHKFINQAQSISFYQSPEYKGTVGLWQNVGRNFQLHILYGLLHYDKDRVGRYTDYHVGRAELTARF